MNRQVSLEETPMLTAEQQYRNWLRSIPRLSDDKVLALFRRAQAGESVRDEIVLTLQYNVYATSAKYMHRDKLVERMDLVGAANIALLTSFNFALTKKDPVAYLVRATQLAMLACVDGRSDTIKTYRLKDSIRVISLDQPVYDDNAEEDCTSLADFLPATASSSPSPMQEEVSNRIWHAIRSLPEKRRIVIERHYGIGEYEPVSLNEVSRLLSPSSRRPCNAHYYHKLALATLSVDLAPVFPQYSTGDA